MGGFRNADGVGIVHRMIRTVQDNAAYLSEIDGATGDGDHGVNMNKGFSLCADRLKGSNEGFSGGLNVLGRVLLMEIGGSMGPLYGTFFRTLAKATRDADVVDLPLYAAAMEASVKAVQDIGKAQVGDKCLIDTLRPAVDSLADSVVSGIGFPEALAAMVLSAEAGKDSTKDLVARIGRASRLGERSRGVLDAGAVSSFLIVEAMARGINQLLGGEE